jgi:hypothetical protein
MKDLFPFPEIGHNVSDQLYKKEDPHKGPDVYVSGISIPNVGASAGNKASNFLFIHTLI